MTHQQGFSLLWTHYVVNRGPSSPGYLEGSTRYMYRTIPGHVDPIGFFIPDSLYSEDMEGLTCEELLTSFPRVRTLIPVPDKYDGINESMKRTEEAVLLEILKALHDDTLRTSADDMTPLRRGFKKRIKTTLETYAEQENLSIPGVIAEV